MNQSGHEASSARPTLNEPGVLVQSKQQGRQGGRAAKAVEVSLQMEARIPWDP